MKQPWFPDGSSEYVVAVGEGSNRTPVVTMEGFRYAWDRLSAFVPRGAQLRSIGASAIGHEPDGVRASFTFGFGTEDHDRTCELDPGVWRAIREDSTLMLILGVAASSAALPSLSEQPLAEAVPALPLRELAPAA